MSVDDACRKAEELIPWVVNRTATPDDEGIFYGHIAECAACRHQLAQATVLRRRMDSAIAAIPKMTPQELAALDRGPARAQGRGTDRVVRMLMLLDAAGLPSAVTAVTRAALDLRTYRPAVRIDVPLVASFDVTL